MLTNEAFQNLQSIADKVTEDGIEGLPGLSFIITDRTGECNTIAAGKLGVNFDKPMTKDSVYWIASFTKILTSICCMQLVEQGKISLDDGDELEKILPEMRDVKVLQKDGTLVEKNKKITLRMLVSHTSGFGYSFFNERIRDWGFPAGVDEFSGSLHDLKQPILFQPGEGWEYGVGLDWAGVAVERVSGGLKLNEYMQKNIFQPLGLKNMNMIPTESMRKNLVHMHHRADNGKIRERDHLNHRALIVKADEEKEEFHNSGGAGMFANLEEFTRILSVFLNDGTDHATGHKLLSKSTVDLMFTNQIPQIPQWGRQGIPASKPDLTNAIPDIYPTNPPDAPQGWGLSMQISGGITGRSETTGGWAGLANLFWWVDREKGVAGVIGSQILPFVDNQLVGTWFKMEGAVYEALAAAAKAA